MSSETFKIPPPPEEGQLSAADIWVVLSSGWDHPEISSMWKKREQAQAYADWAMSHRPVSRYASTYSVMTLEDALYELR